VRQGRRARAIERSNARRRIRSASRPTRLSCPSGSGRGGARAPCRWLLYLAMRNGEKHWTHHRQQALDRVSIRERLPSRAMKHLRATVRATLANGMNRVVAVLIVLLGGCTSRKPAMVPPAPESPPVADWGPPWTRIPDVGFSPFDPTMKPNGIAFRDGEGRPWRMLVGPPTGRTPVIPVQPNGQCPPRTTPLGARQFDPQRLCMGGYQIVGCVPFTYVGEDDNAGTCWYGARDVLPEYVFWSAEWKCWFQWPRLMPDALFFRTVLDPNHIIWVFVYGDFEFSQISWPLAMFQGGPSNPPLADRPFVRRCEHLESHR